MHRQRTVPFFALAILIAFAATSAKAQTPTTVAGSIPGQFSVSESGAATYRIPIQVSPGVAGMQPKLELTYNSQGGNGLLGMGWSLSGLSAITRCPRTMASDGVRGSVNFDLNDRYCLDGQRLILISGTEGTAGAEYRTERESFSKIMAYGSAGNGPAYFIVKTKVGLTMEYGNTEDSRIEAVKAPGSSATWPTGTVRAWAQNRVGDVKGNYYTTTYTEDSANGDFYPSRMDYSGNAATGLIPSGSVRFVYQSRTDSVPEYQAGSISKAMMRLLSVQTYTTVGTADTLVKSYGLAYDYSPITKSSRIKSIQECDGGAIQTCLPALTAVWDGGTTPMPNGFEVPKMWLSNTGSPGGQTYNDGFSYQYFGDFNGDGKTDYMWNYGGWYVALSNGNGFDAPTLWLSNTGAPSGQTYNPGYQYIGDFNGDGKTDYMWNYGGWYVALSNGNGFDMPTLWLSNTGAPSGQTHNNASFQYVGDFNGDGKTDYMWNWGGWYVALSNGNGFDAPTLWLANTGAPSGQTYNPGYQYIGDFNGDGKTDYMWNYGGWYVALSNGNGFDAPTLWLSNTGAPSGQTYNPGYQYIGDFNGDGKTDYMWNYGGWYVALSNGNGFDMPTLWLSNTGALNGQTYNTRYQFFGDFNGDGKTDYMWNYGGWYVATAITGRDIMAVTGSGPGNTTTSFTYKPLTDSTTYTKDSPPTAAVYPKVDLQYPLYVVSRVEQSNGVGGVVATEYKYGGLKAELGTGRGLLGFRWMSAKNLATGVESYTEYRQDYPYTGIPLKNETRLTGAGNGGVLKRSSTTVACQIPKTAAACVVAAGNRYFPHVTQSVEESWDLGGLPYPSITSSYVYGQNPQYGDPTQITVGTSDGASKTTVNEYWPADTANWILGRLKKATVTSSKP